MNQELTTKMNPLEEFFNSEMSEETKQTYRNYIQYFEEYAGIKLVELLDMNVQDVENIIIKYIVTMKKKGLSSSSVKGRVAPMSSFVQLNDIRLNFKKIGKFYPKKKLTVKNDAYTLDELKAMLNIAKPRTRVMVLIYSSTGIRKSALLSLKIRHLEKIPEYGIYKFTIYENEGKDEYYTYCTPECAKAIDEYLQYRKDAGEVITKNSSLVRNDYAKFNDESVNDPQPCTVKNINTVIRNLLLKANLRNPHEEQYERREKQMFHAFRKFFGTTLSNANVNHLVKTRFMGWSTGLEDSYFRPNEQTMLTEYVKAIPALTVSDENRAKVEVQQLKIEASQYASLKDDFEKLRQEFLKQKGK